MPVTEIKQIRCYRTSNCKCCICCLKTKDESSVTHFSYGEVNGKYCCSDDDIHKLILEKKFGETTAVTDCITDFFKYFIDIDFKKKDVDKFKINVKREEFMKHIVNTIKDELNSIIEEKDKLLYIYSDKIDNSEGIHLYFPNIVTDVKNAKYIIESIKNKIVTENLFKLPVQFLDKVIDTSVYRKNGLRILFTSKDGNYYKINAKESIYPNIPKKKCDQLKLVSLKTNEKDINFNLIKQTNNVKDEPIKPIKATKIIKTTKNNNNENKIINEERPFFNNYVKKILKNENVWIDTLKDALSEAVTKLDSNRNNTYETWVNLGMLLFKFGDFGVNLWKEFSKSYINYDENEINRKSKTFSEDEGLEFGSLLRWLKMDNNTYYTEYYNKFKELIQFINIDEEEIEAIELEKLYDHKDIGYVKMYNNKFNEILVCISQEAQTFYLFNSNNKLWELKTIKDIQYHFMDNMKIIIKPLIKYYKKKAKDYLNTNSDQSKAYDKKARDVKRTAEFYKASSSKSIMSLIVSKFYNSNFIKLLNTKKEVLPISGGVLYLLTGEFKERTREDYFSFELETKWRGLDCNITDIDNFFDNIMLNNNEMIQYLQKLLGYSILGNPKEQKFIILWGSGGNGKSLLMNLLKKLMGDYYRQLTSDVILQTNKNVAGSASPHLMLLLGSRIACVDESDMESKLNESVVKNITGGSPITARALYKDLVTFDPTFQLFLLTNYKPIINVSNSIKRRLELLPFLAEFKDEKTLDPTNKRHKLADSSMEIKLYNCLDQLLVWLVKGCIKYNTEGLGDMPDVIKNATNDYLNENDDLGTFLGEVCDIDKDGFAFTSKIYNLFIKQYKVVSHKVFAQLMKEKGYVLAKRNGYKGYRGLRIKVYYQEDNDELEK